MSEYNVLSESLNKTFPSFSGSVNGTGPELSMMRVYETVKDVVYKGEFVLPMLYDGSKVS